MIPFETNNISLRQNLKSEKDESMGIGQITGVSAVTMKYFNIFRLFLI